ncbi:MAG: carbon storage regulator [Planctomycetia bacterium]|nr:carbon storage regulator [Planctomycetia bacterium]
MLILSRRIGEQIRIDEHTVLTVLKVRGQQVQLGFEAPAAVSIIREELIASGRRSVEDERQVAASY